VPFWSRSVGPLHGLPTGRGFSFTAPAAYSCGGGATVAVSSPHEIGQPGLQEMYDRGFQEEDRSYSDIESTKLVLAEQRLLLPGMRVLDIGCGGGLLMRHLLSLGLEVVGTDISKVAVESLRRRGFEAYTGAAEQLPFPDQSFDFITSCDVIEHLFDQDSHLCEVRRVLRPGGVYYIQTPNKPLNILYLALLRYRNWRAYHPSLRTMGSLRKLLAHHGFAARFVLPSRSSEYVQRVASQAVGSVLAKVLTKIRPSMFPPFMYHTLFVIAERQA
jgi:ubiquinone/menaquinone biosynthesis C-methylase UbiE